MEVNFDYYFSTKEKKSYNVIYEKLVTNKMTLNKEFCFKFMSERANI